jgi:hypothetical protein
MLKAGKEAPIAPGSKRHTPDESQEDVERAKRRKTATLSVEEVCGI